MLNANMHSPRQYGNCFEEFLLRNYDSQSEMTSQSIELTGFAIVQWEMEPGDSISQSSCIGSIRIVCVDSMKLIFIFGWSSCLRTTNTIIATTNPDSLLPGVSATDHSSSSSKCTSPASLEKLNTGRKAWARDPPRPSKSWKSPWEPWNKTKQQRLMTLSLVYSMKLELD